MIPDGLSYDAATRTLSGTPIGGAAARSLTYTVTDADDNTFPADSDSLVFSVRVRAVPMVSVSPNRVRLSEGGAAAFYNVALTRAPDAAGVVTVTLGITPADHDLSAPAMLTFTADDWRDARTVTVTAGLDSDAQNDTATISHTLSGGGYDAVDAGAVEALVVDSANPGVDVPLFDDDAAPAAQTFVRGRAIAPLVLPAAFGGDGELSYTLEPLAALPGLSFDAATRALAGTPAATTAPVTLTYTAFDSDANRNPFDSPALQFTVAVVAPPEVILMPATLNIVEMSGGEYGVALSTRPDGAVTVTPTLPHNSRGVLTLSPAALTFTPADWQTAQTFSVSALRDDDGDTATVVFSHAVSGYGEVTASAPLTVVISDLPVASISLTPARVSEADAPTTVALCVQVSGVLPPAGLTFLWESSGSATVGALLGEGDISVTPDPIAFASPRSECSNIRIHEDEIAEGEETATFTLSETSGAEVLYAPRSATLTIEDDDTAGIILSRNGVVLAEGGFTTYTVSLLSGPDANVTVTSSHDAAEAVAVVPAALTFTAANWNTAQTATINALEDDNDFTDDIVVIRHTLSGAPGYAGLEVPSIFLEITDDDRDFAPGLPANFADTLTFPIQLPLSHTLVEAFGGLNLPFIYALRGALPEGLSFNPDTRVIAGTPTEVGVFPLTYAVTDSDNNRLASDETRAQFDLIISPVIISLTEPAIALDRHLEETSVTVQENSMVQRCAYIVYPAAGQPLPPGNAYVRIHNNRRNIDTADADDVTPLDRVLVFNADNRQRCVSSSVIDDEVSESGLGDYFTITLEEDTQRPSDFAVDFATRRNRVGIQDDDPVLIGWSENQSDVNEHEGAATLTIELKVPPSERVELTEGALDGQYVFVEIVGGTADEGQDYTAITDFLRPSPSDGMMRVLVGPFTNEVRSRTFDVPIINDDLAELPETIFLRLSHALLAGVPSHVDINFPGARFAPDDDRPLHTVVIDANDSAQVVVLPRQVTLNEGDIGVYTVRVDAAPAAGADVVVTPTLQSGDHGVSFAPLPSGGALTFTSANWNTVQTVTLSAAEDDQDLEDEATTVTHTVTATGTYAGVRAGSVAVTVRDDDLPPDAVPTFDAVVEDQYFGEDVRVDLTLPEATGGNGALTYALSPLASLPDGLTFDAQTRVISGTPTAPRAPVAFEYVAIDADINTTRADAATQSFIITVGVLPVTIRWANTAEGRAIDDDPDTRGFQIAQDNALTGDSSHLAHQTLLTVALPGEFAASVPMRVVVAVSPEARDADLFTLDGNPLPPALTFTFTRGTPFLQRAIDIRSSTQVAGGGDNFQFSIASVDSFNYEISPFLNRIEGNVLPTNLPDYTLTPVASMVMENTDYLLDVALAFPQQSPDVTLSGPVTFQCEVEGVGANPASAADVGRCRMRPIAPSDVTGSGANRRATGRVVLPALADRRNEGAEGMRLRLTHIVFNAGTPQETRAAIPASAGTAPDFTISDVGPGVAFSTPTLTVAEGGRARYGVFLTTDPGGNVGVQLRSDNALLTFEPDALVFSAAQWNVPQTVVVIAGDDPASLADVLATITHTVSDYPGALSDRAVEVRIVNTSGNTAPSFGGAQQAAQTYIAAQEVSLTLPEASGGNGDLTYALSPVPPGLSFTAATRVLAGMPQPSAAAALTYTVADSDINTGADDTESLTFTVTTRVRPAVVVTPAALTVDEGEAGETYTVALSTAPLGGGGVVVTPDPRPEGHLLTLAPPDALTFTAGDWNVAQTVTVSAARDPDTENNTATIAFAVSGYGGVLSIATNGAVTTGAVTEGPPLRVITTDIFEDVQPDFGAASVDAQTYTASAAAELTLPPATGGNGPLVYTLPGLPDGLSFDPDTRILSGVPVSIVDAVQVTYTVRDTDDDDTAADTDSLSFTVTVIPNVVTLDWSSLTALDADAMTAGAQVRREPTAGETESIVMPISVRLAQPHAGAQPLEVTLGYSGFLLSDDLFIGINEAIASLRPTLTLTFQPGESVVTTDVRLSRRADTHGVLPFSARIASLGGADATNHVIAEPRAVDGELLPAFLPSTLVVSSAGTVAENTFAEFPVELQWNNTAYGLFDPRDPITFDCQLRGEPRTVPNPIPGFGSGRIVTVPAASADDYGECSVSPITRVTGDRMNRRANAIVRVPILPDALTEGALGTGSERFVITLTHLVFRAGTPLENRVPVSQIETNPAAISAEAVIRDVMNELAVVPYAPVTIPEGGVHHYTVFLTTNPDTVSGVTGANVNVAITSDNTDVTVSPSALVFTAADWNVPVSVTLTTLPDDLEFTNDLATITHAVSGYGTTDSGRMLSVTVADDDVDIAPFYPTPPLPRELTFVAGQALNLTLPEASGGNGELNYGTTNNAEFLASQGLTFDPDTRVLSGTMNNLRNSVFFVVRDEDENEIRDSTGYRIFLNPVPAPAITVTPATLTVNEESSATYTVNIVRAPNVEVTVTPQAVPPDPALTFIPPRIVFAPSASPDFTASLAVTVVAARDADSRSSDLTVTHSVAGFTGVRVALQADGSEVLGDVTAGDNLALTIRDIYVDTAPAFADGVSVPDYTFAVTTQVAGVSLPAASGGNGDLSYELRPDIADVVPGLSFDPIGRTLSGIPSAVADAVMLTYHAIDDDDNPAVSDDAVLTFSVTIRPLRTTREWRALNSGEVLDSDPDTAGYQLDPDNADYAGDTELAVVLEAPHAGPGTLFVQLQLSEAMRDPRLFTDSEGAALSQNTLLYFAIGESRRAITVRLQDDPLADGAREFSVRSPPGGTSGHNYRRPESVALTGVVLANDLPTITLSAPATGTVAENTVATFSVLLEFPDSGGLAGATTLECAITGVSVAGSYTAATPGADTGACVVDPLAPADVTGAANARRAETVIRLPILPDADDTEGLEGARATLTRVHFRSGESGGASSVDWSARGSQATVVIREADPGLALSTERLLVTEETGSADYTVALASAPDDAQGAQIALSGPANRFTFDPAALVFSADNWAQAQTVTVRALADFDLADDTVAITHTVSGYAGVTSVALTAVVSDDDEDTAPVFADGVSVDDQTYVVGQAVSLAFPTAIAGSGNFGNIYNLRPAIAGVVPGLTFQRARRMLVGSPTAAVEDGVLLTFVADDADGNTAPSDTATLVFRLTVLPRPAVVVAPAALGVDEESAAAYTVRLSALPSGGDAARVVVGASVSPANHDLTLSPAATLTFTAADWNVAQTVTVAAARDADAEDDTATISHSVQGYTGITAINPDGTVTAAVTTAPPVVVTVADTYADVVPQFAVQSLPAQTYVVRAGIAALTLPEATGGNGAITYALSPRIAAAIPGLAFNPFSRVLSGVPARATATQTFTFTARDADTNTAPEDEARLALAISVSPVLLLSPAALVVNEGGEATYSVALSDAPAAGESVGVRPSVRTADSGLSLRPLTLGFTRADWNVPQTVIVRAAEDNVDFADSTATLAHAVNALSGIYAGLSAAGTDVAPDLVVTSIDNDRDMPPTFDGETQANLLFTRTRPVSVRLPVAIGGNGAITYRLLPLSAIPDGLRFDSDTRLLSGTPSAASGAAMLTYTALDGDRDTVSLRFSVTVRERLPGVTVAPRVLTVVEGATTDTATYTVRLTVAPADGGRVRITNTPPAVSGFSLNGGGAVALTFDSANWNVPQTVNATALADDDLLGLATSVTFAAHDLGGAPGYAATAVDAADFAPLAVMITDPDSGALVFEPPARALTEGGNTHYTVRLAKIPRGGVVRVTPTSADPARASVLSASPGAPGGGGGALVFRVDDWNIAQTVRVVTRRDADAAEDTVAITHTVSAAQSSGYDTLGANGGEVTLTLRDDDTRGIVLSPPSLTVPEGERAVFSAALATRPSGGDVMLSAALSAGATGVSLSPQTALTFSAANWDTPQTFTATSAQDADSADETFVITVNAAGADYGGLSATLAGRVRDNEAAGVVIAPDALTFAEGASAVYTVRLNSNPGAASVTVTPVLPVNELVELLPSGALTFNAGNWNIERAISVTAMEDQTDGTDDTATITHSVTASGGDGAYAAVQAGDVTLVITDNDVPGVAITPAALTVDEITGFGRISTGNYTVVLRSPPIADGVVIRATSGNDDAVRISGGAALTFARADWNVAQTVTVAAVNDNDEDDETVTITHSVSGANYEGFDASGLDVTVTVIDDDFDIAPTFGGQRQSDLFFLLERAVDVQLPLASGGNRELVYSLTPGGNIPEGVTFTAATRTLSGEPREAVEARTVTYTVRDSDTNRAAADTDTLLFTLAAVPAPTVTVAAGDLRIRERRAGAYRVTLSALPEDSVTVTPRVSPAIHDLTLSHGGVALVSPGDETGGALTFTVGNWHLAQTVSVAAGADLDAADDRATISHTVQGGGADYAGVTAGDVAVTTEDTETAGLDVSAAVTGVRPAEGGAATYTLVLESQPAGGDVTVSPLSSDPDVAAVSPATLVFTAVNWNTPREVEVRGVQDADAVADPLVTITHAVAGADYGEFTDPLDSVVVTVGEDDAVGFTVSATDLSIAEESGGDSYTVVLRSAPSAGVVTVTPLSADPALARVSGALTFGATNWFLAQRVSVTAGADADAADTDVVISHAPAVSDAGSDYNGVRLDATVTVTVTDNDVRAITAPSAALVVREGEATTFGMALATQPIDAGAGVAAAVVLTASISPSDHDLSLTPATLTFTAADWNQPQQVVARGGEDDDSDNDDFVITWRADGADYTPRGTFITANMLGAIRDNDVAAVDIAPRELEVNEADDTPATYTLRLRANPGAATVVVTPQITAGEVSSLLTLLPFGGVAFTRDNWRVAVTFTVTAAAGDDDPDGIDTATITHAVAVTGGGIYAGITAADVVVTVVEEVADARFTPVTLIVAEGGAGAYTVELLSQPRGGDVTVRPMSADTAIATVSPAALTFTAADWNTPQTVAVSGVADADGDTDIAAITHEFSGANYDSYTPPQVQVTVLDTQLDAPPTFISDAPADLNYVQWRAVSTVFPEAVSANGGVTYTLTPESAFPAGLTFDAATRTLAGLPREAVVARSLTYTAADTDGNTAASDTRALTFSVTVAAAAPVVVSTERLRVAEEGDAAYTIVLAVQPLSTVRVSSAISPPGTGLTLTPSADLLFTPTTWNNTRTLRVSAAADADGSDDTATISHAVFGTGIYSAITPREVVVTTEDDETRGLRLSATALEVQEGGASGIYTVALTAQPLGGDVTVTPQSGDDTVASVSAALTFSAANWDTPQVVSVGGLADDDAVADAPVTISHAFSGESDYGALDVRAADSVVVTVIENATPGIVLEPPALMVTEGERAVYNVTLASAPQGGVGTTMAVVAPFSDNASVVAVQVPGGRLTFTADDWNQPQSVTVLSVPDADAVAEAVVTIGHTVTGTPGSDYETLPPADVAVARVTVIETETRALVLTTLGGAALTSLRVREDESAAYRIALASAPRGGVGVVTVQADITPPDGDVSLNTATLTFTAGDWNQPRTVVARAAGDADEADENFVITHTAAGADYEGEAVSASISGVLIDNAAARVEIEPLELVTREGNANGFYTVRLNADPGDATVALSAALSPASANLSLSGHDNLTFTTDNWNVSQTVFVAAAADNDRDGETVTVSHTVVSAGGVYAGVSAADVRVVSRDLTPRIVFSPSTPPGVNLRDRIMILEGESITITATLTGPPLSGDVDLLVSFGDVAVVFANQVAIPADRISLSGGEDRGENSNGAPQRGVVFTRANWRTPRTFTVATTRVDEDVVRYSGVFAAETVLDGATVRYSRMGDVGILDTDVSIPRTEITVLDSDLFPTFPSGIPSTLTFTQWRPVNYEMPRAIGGNGTLTYSLVNPHLPGLSFNPDTHTLEGRPSNAFITVINFFAHDTDSTRLPGDPNTAGFIFAVTIEAASPRVLLSRETLTVTERATTGYTVELEAPPDGLLTVALSLAPPGHGLELSPDALTFSADNWETARSVRVTAGPDADGADSTATITHAFSGGGTLYAGLDEQRVVVTTEDIDPRGLTLTRRALSITEGALETYAVSLDTQPRGGDATVTPTSDAPAVAALSPPALTFTAGNWAQPQAVTVSAIADPDAVSEAPVTITHALSGESDYGALTLDAADDAVVVTVLETGSVGVVVEPQALRIAEDADGIYRITLTSAPSAGVVSVQPRSDNTTAVVLRGDTTLTFTAADWNVTQTVTVAGVPDTDAIAPAPVAVRHTLRVSDADSDYASATAAPVVVTVTETHRRAIVITPPAPLANRALREGERSTFTVALDSEPTAEVIVRATITPSGGDLTLTPETLTFATNEWNVARTVTATAAEDADAADDAVSIAYAASGGDYAAVTAAVSGAIRDNEVAAVEISPLTLSAAENGSGRYTVRLNADPGAATVTVRPFDSGAEELRLQPVGVVLTFTTDNWQTERTVRVLPQDDADDTNDIGTVSHEVVVTGGGVYENVAASDVTVRVRDDDAAVRITPLTQLVFETDAEYAAGFYTVSLTNQPVGGDARVDVASQRSGKLLVETLGGLRPPSFIFTAANWQTPRTVVLLVLPDADDTHDRVEVRHFASGGSYSSVIAPSATIIINDDEGGNSPEFEAEQAALTFIRGRAAEAQLLAAVRGNGALNYALTPIPPGLSFDAPTRTLSGTPDTAGDTALTYSVTDSDTDTRAVDSDTLTFTVTVAEPPNVALSVSDLRVSENAAATYSVALTAQPATTLTVSPRVLAGFHDITVSGGFTLVFSPTTWNDGQTVTLTAGADADAVDDTATVVHEVTGGLYARVAAEQRLAVTTDDSEVADVTFMPAALTVDEDGGSGHYVVALLSSPIVLADHSEAVITITPISAQPGVVMVSPAALTFSGADWNVGQTVSITAVADLDAVQDDTIDITHAVSGDSNYGDFTDADDTVRVTLDETDTAGYVLPAAVSVREGDSVVYGVALTSQPFGGDVVLTPASGDTGVVVLDPPNQRLVFTTADWNVA